MAISPLVHFRLLATEILTDLLQKLIHAGRIVGFCKPHFGRELYASFDNQEPMQLSIHSDDGVIVYGQYTRQAVFESVQHLDRGH